MDNTNDTTSNDATNDGGNMEKEDSSTAKSVNDIDVVLENAKGRYDEYGRFVKNVQDENYFMDRFRHKTIVQPLAAVLVLTEYNRPVRGDVYHALHEIGVPYQNVKGFHKSGIRSFTLKFINKTWKNFAIDKVLQKFSQKYRLYSLVPEFTKVTVGEIPDEMTDEDVLSYLNLFGEFSSDNVVYLEDDMGRLTDERVYTGKNLLADLPSYAVLFGCNLTIRYRKQPYTCRMCGEQGHKSYECPNDPRNKGMRIGEIVNEVQDAETTNAVGAESPKDLESREGTDGSVQTQGAASSKHTSIVKSGWAAHVMNSDIRQRRMEYQMQRQGRDRFPLLPANNANNGSFPYWGREKEMRSQRVSTAMKVRNEKRQQVRQINRDPITRKLEQTQRIITDGNFGEKPADPLVVEKCLHELKDMITNENDSDNHEESFFDHAYVGSSSSIKQLFEYDMKLLSNCYDRSGRPGDTKISSPAFQRVVKDYLSGLEEKEKELSKKRNRASSDEVSPAKKAVGEDETHPLGEYQNDGVGNNNINIIDVNDLTGDE